MQAMIHRPSARLNIPPPAGPTRWHDGAAEPEKPLSVSGGRLGGERQGTLTLARGVEMGDMGWMGGEGR